MEMETAGAGGGAREAAPPRPQAVKAWARRRRPQPHARDACTHVSRGRALWPLASLIDAHQATSTVLLLH